MDILDDIRLIQTYDPSRTLESICNLAKQCKSAWDEAKNVTIPFEYKKASSILFCGMGGSAYGARIIKSLYGLTMRVPVDLVSDYHIPAYAGENTLVICASYSGTTEETISCAKDAIAHNAKIIGISSGGPLYVLLHSQGYPYYKFDPVYNPSRQPRIGQGYMQMGQISLLTKTGFLKVSDEDIDKMIKELETQRADLVPEKNTRKNSAKQLALKFETKQVHLIAAEFLEGATHAVRNPVHETGKHFATYAIVPELNHHLMEGLSYPTSIRKDFIFVLIQSLLYSDNIKKRMKLTADVIRKNGIAVAEIHLTGKTKLSQSFELIQLGSFISFYLAMLHRQDPSKVQWVDYFKKNLSDEG